MHIRVVTVRRHGQEHRYCQLVQSYRRADGMPAQRLIAGLGEQPDSLVENLRAALAASRSGLTLLVASEIPKAWPVTANLAYLDVALVLALAQESGLRALLNQCLGEADRAIVEALIVQRCVAPGSKLYAQRWYPTTALPELLDVASTEFNNTRLHRVLQKLDRAHDGLQCGLTSLVHQDQGPFTALFLDVTDAYFEGRGCEMAEYRRSKEGLRNKRCVGVVLLCSRLGFPLQWQVIPGRCQDPQAMGDMVHHIQDQPWAANCPVVCDRAMGQPKSLDRLQQSGLQFLTAAPVDEIERYTNRLPVKPFKHLSLGNTEKTIQDDLRQVRQAALAAGLQEVDERLYVLDLGVCHPEEALQELEPTEAQRIVALASSSTPGAAGYLRLAQELSARFDLRNLAIRRSLARKLGMSPSRLRTILYLSRLPQDILEVLLADNGPQLTEFALRPLFSLNDPQEQRRRFQEIIANVAANPRRRPARRRTQIPLETHPEPSIPVRLVVYFNPEMFLEQQQAAQKRLTEIQVFVADLNQQLASPHSRRREIDVRRAVIRKLERYQMLDVFEVVIHASDRKSLSVELQLRHDEWQQRRKYDGFVLLLGHPELKGTATEVAQLYRAKDTIEKDFQHIKGIVELRPIFHHTDPKVRAHITLCMLALFINRCLEQRLKNSPDPHTAAACYERLAPCHLNILEAPHSDSTLYTITRPSPEQLGILNGLNLLHLTEEKEVTKVITPR